MYIVKKIARKNPICSNNYTKYQWTEVSDQKTETYCFSASNTQFKTDSLTTKD